MFSLPEERLGHVAGFAEENVDQGAVAVDRPIEIAPFAGDFDVGLVDVPAPAGLAGPALAQALGKQWGQLGFPIPHRFVGEHDAADQEYLRQITQAQLVAQPPEEKHDVSRHLAPVQRRGGPLVEPPPAIAAPETPEAMNRSPFPLGGRRRVAMRAVHSGSLDRSKQGPRTYPLGALSASCPEI